MLNSNVFHSDMALTTCNPFRTIHKICIFDANEQDTFYWNYVKFAMPLMYKSACFTVMFAAAAAYIIFELVHRQ